jgi:hypothetical protein
MKKIKKMNMNGINNKKVLITSNKSLILLINKINKKKYKKLSKNIGKIIAKFMSYSKIVKKLKMTS